MFLGAHTTYHSTKRYLITKKKFLKKGKINHIHYLDSDSAQLTIFQYVEGSYNRKKIHGGIKYRTPLKMEKLALTVA